MYLTSNQVNNQITVIAYKDTKAIAHFIFDKHGNLQLSEGIDKLTLHERVEVSDYISSVIFYRDYVYSENVDSAILDGVSQFDAHSIAYQWLSTPELNDLLIKNYGVTL